MKKKKVFLIYHSHIDIGYTERQEKMSIYQADFMNQAIDCALSERQKNRGEQNKFKFVAEGFWAVEQFLKRYGNDGRRKLIQAIKSGYFEITGGYLHFAELLNGDNLSHSLDYSTEFLKKNNLLNTEVAMASDINGFSYYFADALYEHGIKYLITNINSHHGGVPFGKPLVPFYWETFKGHKILVWNGLTYHKANLLGLIPGSMPIGDPGVPGMKVDETGFIEIKHPNDYASKQIFAMFNALEQQGYAYDFIPLMGSGLYTDNSPACDSHCDFIDEWNKQYGNEIEIVTSTLKEFFEYLQMQMIDIKSYSGDWNDWWTDGVLSTPNDVRLFRNAQRLQKQIKKLDKDKKFVSDEDMEAISNKLILYAEHTWGHSSSYSDPCKLLVQQLDSRKSKLAIDADVLASTAYDKVARCLGEGEFTCKREFVYEVINPNNFAIKTAVYLPTDFWEEAHFLKNEYFIKDGEDCLLSQRTFTLRGSFVVAVVSLAANETKKLELIFKPLKTIAKNCLDTNSLIFKNDFYKLSYANGGVGSIINLKTNSEMLENSNFKLGEPAYQVFPNADRSKAAGFGYSKRTIPIPKNYKGKCIETRVKETGNVFTTLISIFEVEGVEKYAVQYTLFNELSKIDMNVDVIKKLVMDPEGLYVTLPFKMLNGEWYLDKPNTLISPKNHLPNSCCDYFPVERGVLLSDGEYGIAINTLDTPLITIGKMKLWDYSTEIVPTGNVYSWLLNNKWETNFRAQCSGCYESRYIIDFAKGNENEVQHLLEINEMELPVFRH